MKIITEAKDGTNILRPKVNLCFCTPESALYFFFKQSLKSKKSINLSIFYKFIIVCPYEFHMKILCKSNVAFTPLTILLTSIL